MINLRFDNYGSGFCQNCGCKSDDLLLATINRDNTADQKVLCRNCCVNLQSEIAMQNTEQLQSGAPAQNAEQPQSNAPMQNAWQPQYQTYQQPVNDYSPNTMTAASSGSAADSGSNVIKIIIVCAVGILLIIGGIALFSSLAGNSSSPSSYSDGNSFGSQFESFTIEGKWKNVGTTTCAQIQRGSIVTFDGAQCNVYSPFDSYAFYEQGGEYRLDCTSPFAGDSLCFKVNIIDSDNIELINGSTVVQLMRVG